jgi:chromosome segregation ATPase
MSKFWESLGKVTDRVGLTESESHSDEAPPSVAPSGGSNSSVASPISKSVPSRTDPEAQAKLAELDKAARQQLIQAMEDSKVPLVEELGDLLESLRESIPDEKALYKAALKILVKKGSSISAICSDMDKCIGVLEDKDREFLSQLKSQFDKRVGSKKTAVDSCKQQVDAKRVQIRALESDISTLETQGQEAQGSISEEEEKLSQVQGRFEMVYRATRSEIESQRAKIAQYGEKL